MECPHCQATTRVLESRGAEAGAAVRRRRQCSACGRRFTTYERYERLLFVRKRSGDRQAFDREKLHGGLARAAHKRPVPEDEIDAIVDLIAGEVEGAGGELPAQRIGEMCLEGLRRVDRVAYLQFAAVYKELSDIDEVQAELARMRAELPAQDEALFETPVFAGAGGPGSVRSKGDPA
ncbi:MAG: transcriptional regulator NrdR [Actinomycetota bacterium]